MGIFVMMITVAFFAHWTCSLTSMQWCSCMGWNAGVCCSHTSFCRSTRFPLLFNASP